MGQSNLSSNTRRPIVAHTFDFVSQSKGLVTLNRAVNVVGVKSSAGTAVASVPTLVGTEAEIDAAAGVGSELAMTARSVLKQWRYMGVEAVAQLYVTAVTAPAGVQATFLFTVVGTATAAGDVVFKISGRTIRAAVNLGDTQNTIAAAMKAAADAAAADLPGTSSVATNVHTFTARTNGVNGNDIKATVVSSPAGVVVTPTAGVAGTGVASLVAALDASGGRDYDAIAIANHAAQDITDLNAHMVEMWGMTRQRWRWAFVGMHGTIGSAVTLATAANRPQIVIGSYEDCPNLPAEIAGALAAVPVAFDRPSQNYDGVELWLDTPADASVYLASEIETALAGGLTPITVTDGTRVSKLERLVTTKTTEAGAPFENLLDLSNSRTMAFYARQIDAKIKRTIRGQSLDADLIALCESVAYAALLDGQEAGDLHHVEEYRAMLRGEAHPSIPTRLLLDVPEAVVPNCHQVDATHRMIIEGA